MSLIALALLGNTAALSPAHVSAVTSVSSNSLLSGVDRHSKTASGSQSLFAFHSPFLTGHLSLQGSRNQNAKLVCPSFARSAVLSKLNVPKRAALKGWRMVSGGSSQESDNDTPPLDERFEGWVEKSSAKAEMLEVICFTVPTQKRDSSNTLCMNYWGKRGALGADIALQCALMNGWVQGEQSFLQASWKTDRRNKGHDCPSCGRPTNPLQANTDRYDT